MVTQWETNKRNKRNAMSGGMGAASKIPPLTDEEAIEIRERFGYILKTKGKRGSKSSGIHIPKEEGSEEPLCNSEMRYNDGVSFAKKDNSILPHSYVKDSAYTYCKHCVRRWRND